MICLEDALEEQLQIKTKAVIPNKHNPKHLFTEDKEITKQFVTQYKQLFFKYLNEVVKSNQFKLEECKTNLKLILKQTDEEVLAIETSQEDLRFHYSRFLKTNDIEQHTPSPRLQNKLKVPIERLSTSSKRNRRRRTKRKCETQPAVIKKYKTNIDPLIEHVILPSEQTNPQKNHFLSLGHNPVLMPD